MRTIKKRNLAILILAMAVMGTGMSAVYANADETDKNSPVSELVQAIADKFSLDANEVQAVFNEQREIIKAEREKQRTEMQAKMEQEFNDQLKHAVTNGDLTQDQANVITEKRKEIQAERESNMAAEGSAKGMTDAERAAQRQKMQAQMDELKAWAKKNNIPQKYLVMRAGTGRGNKVPGDGFNINK